MTNKKTLVFIGIKPNFKHWHMSLLKKTTHKQHTNNTQTRKKARSLTYLLSNVK